METPRPKGFNVLNRRHFLLAAIAATLFKNNAVANNSLTTNDEKLNWSVFYKKMFVLAKGNFSEDEIVKFGNKYLSQLDIHSDDFNSAVNDSYESGNRYWLWQRMIKSPKINGGILNIENNQMIQLHDHPGAIGLLRIISGETEVWQFDVIKEKQASNGKNIVHLERKSHKVLRPGDTAVLTSSKGNIHALKAVTKECRMLDFFIPPYQRSLRNWYIPTSDNWVNKESIVCRKISENDFTMT